MTREFPTYVADQQLMIDQGTIFHIMIFDSVEKAAEQYPDYIDYILDTMNSEGFKTIIRDMNTPSSEPPKLLDYDNRSI
jgi:hypothetical protein